MILSDAELLALTGYSRASSQVRWLSQHGWRYTLTCRGRPIVARAEFEAQLVSGKVSAPESAIRWGEVKHGRKAA